MHMATNKDMRIYYPNEEERNFLNEDLIDAIIYLVKAHQRVLNKQKKYPKLICQCGWGPNHALNQTIRKYIIPPHNWHITKEALNTWKDNYSADVIWRFTYDEPIKEANRANICKFNKVFYSEQTTPVDDVINCLLEICKDDDARLHDRVKNCLEKIHITVMLKGQQKGIKSKGRISDWEAADLFGTIVSKYYKTKTMGIKINVIEEFPRDLSTMSKREFSFVFVLKKVLKWFKRL